MLEHANVPVGTAGQVQHDCGQMLDLEAVLDQDDITTTADIPPHLHGTCDVDHLPCEYRRFNRRGVLLYWWHGAQEVRVCPRCGKALPLGRAHLPEEDAPVSSPESGAPGGVA